MVGALIPGEFVIRTFDTYNYISWFNNPYLDTSADQISEFETFTFTTPQYYPQYTAIQALNGQYVTVAPGGGLTLTDTEFQESHFALIGPQYDPSVPGEFFGFNIRTRNGPFVSAVNGGNFNGSNMNPPPNAFLTDVTVAEDWEAFAILKTGDLGSGYRYIVKPVGNAGPIPVPGFNGIFTLIKTSLVAENENGYVFQLSNGFNYLTAVESGGQLGPFGEVFHTDAWKPQSWEFFIITYNIEATYFIQTASGFYLGYNPSTGEWSSDIELPIGAPPGYTTNFEFLMVRTPVPGDLMLGN
jgi:hypothetical protein